METATALILLAAAVVFLCAVMMLRGRGAAGGVRRYRSQVTLDAPSPAVDSLEEDAVYLWRLRCAGRAASRRAVTRRGDMSVSAWNRASQLMSHLALDVYRMSEAEGIERIRGYLAEQRRLAESRTFVRPWEG